MKRQLTKKVQQTNPLPYLPPEVWRECIFPFLQHLYFQGPIIVSKAWFQTYLDSKKKISACSRNFKFC